MKFGAEINVLDVADQKFLQALRVDCIGIGNGITAAGIAYDDSENIFNAVQMMSECVPVKFLAITQSGGNPLPVYFLQGYRTAPLDGAGNPEECLDSV